MIGFADGAGIEESGGAVRLVAGNMGVPVEGEIRPRGHGERRFVNKEEGAAAAVQGEGFRSDPAGIAVAAHSVEGRPETSKLLQNFLRADVPEMPDFIRRREKRPERGGEAVVGVGDDGDSHA